MSIFIIDYDQLIRVLLPLRLRATIFIAYCKVAMTSVQRNYDDLNSVRAAHLYEIVHNGQVCKLQAVLNDRFDNALRRIYIIDGLVILPLFTYKRIEAKPVYMRKRSEATGIRYMRKRSELSLGGTFIVMVPTVLVFDMHEMKALTNKYKQAGKAYTIQTF